MEKRLITNMEQLAEFCLELMESFEDQYDPTKASAFVVTDEGVTHIAEGEDVYFMMATLGRAEQTLIAQAKAFGVLTSGWGAPINGEDPDDITPSEHPDRVRIKLVHVVSEVGSGSAMRIAGEEEILTESGQSSGMLKDAIDFVWEQSHKNYMASMN